MNHFAIVTTYHNPTDTKGARVCGRAVGWSLRAATLAWDHGTDDRGNHVAAAMRVMVAFSRGFRMVSAPIGDGKWSHIVSF